ncbi:MAG: nucleotide exchange factor GrpE [Bdellovibrionota bacterium]
MSDSKTNNGEVHSEATSTATNGAGELNNEMQKLQEQTEKFKNDYLYLRAEFDNFRKNTIKERADLLKFGARNLAVDLLAVLDNFERANSVTVTSENFSTFVKGIEMTSSELKNALTKNGISEIICEGQPFDPSLHEALSSEISDTAQPGSILRVFQKGYRLQDKIIRPAQVVVARKPE